MDEIREEKCLKSLSNEEKRAKIKSNYETIDALKERLAERKNREKRGITRAAYIKMIYDITRKVDQQDSDLNKIVVGTRGLQKDIRSLSGRLERSFTLAKDGILKVCLFTYSFTK